MFHYRIYFFWLSALYICRRKLQNKPEALDYMTALLPCRCFFTKMIMRFASFDAFPPRFRQFVVLIAHSHTHARARLHSHSHYHTVYLVVCWLWKFNCNLHVPIAHCMMTLIINSREHWCRCFSEIELYSKSRCYSSHLMLILTRTNFFSFFVNSRQQNEVSDKHLLYN